MKNFDDSNSVADLTPICSHRVQGSGGFGDLINQHYSPQDLSFSAAARQQHKSVCDKKSSFAPDAHKVPAMTVSEVGMVDAA